MLQNLLLVPWGLDQKVVAFAPAGAEGQKGTEPVDGLGITRHRHEGAEDLKVLEGAHIEMFPKWIKKTIKHLRYPDDSFHGNLRWGSSPDYFIDHEMNRMIAFFY